MNKKQNRESYVEIYGYNSMERNVRARGSTGGLTLPKSWLGGQVKVVLVENEGITFKKGDINNKIGEKSEKTYEMSLYRVYGYEMVIKTVKPHGRGAIVLLPKSWVGKRVKVILIEKPKKED